MPPKKKKAADVGGEATDDLLRILSEGPPELSESSEHESPRVLVSEGVTGSVLTHEIS